MKMAHHDIFDVIRLQPNLLQLAVNRHIRGIDRLQSSERSAPVRRIRDDSVVIPRVEENIPFRMHNYKEADRYLNLRCHRRIILKNALTDGEGARTERVQLD